MVRPGQSPGSLVHIGRRYGATRLEEIRYDAHAAGRRDVQPTGLERVVAGVSWLDVTGVHDAALLRQVGATFSVPDLVLEDVMNTHHRAKFEDRPGGGFAVLRMMQWRDGVVEEQVSLWWDAHNVVTFQEQAGDPLDIVRERILGHGVRIRQMPASYLAYAIIDAVVDHLAVVLDHMSDALNDLEEQVLQDWRSVQLEDIQHQRRQVAAIRRAAGPIREMAQAMQRSDQAFDAAVRPYLQDLTDHTLQSLDLLEHQRDQAAGVRELWMNQQAGHMNRVMQTLTVVATVFIPLTFLAGVYGTNFADVPEYSWRYGYHIFLGVNAVLVLALLWWFRRRAWL